MVASRPFLLAFAVLLLVTSPPPSAEGLSLGQWGTLLSLSRSLLNRVANARVGRGDIAGADRARRISDHLSLINFGESGGIWSLGWDFARNYAWRGGIDAPTGEISRAAERLLAVLAEDMRMDSGVERGRWMLRKLPELVSLSDSLIQGLLKVFSRSGPLREMIKVIQKEVLEGELLRDCVEVSAADLEGLIRIARDILASNSGHWEL